MFLFLKDINKIHNHYQIHHSINTEKGSSGSPLILDTRNLKIIGIHCGKSSNLKRGIYMKEIIKDIEKQILKKKINLEIETPLNLQYLDSITKEIKTVNTIPIIPFKKNKFQEFKIFPPFITIEEKKMKKTFKKTKEINHKIYDIYSKEEDEKNNFKW